MAARWLGTEVAMSMNLMRFISCSQLTRPTSVVYGEGAADDEDGDAMARAAAGEGVALAQEKLRRRRQAFDFVLQNFSPRSEMTEIREIRTKFRFCRSNRHVQI